MSGDGVLISAVITLHRRPPPAQVPALRMMRADGGGGNDALGASSCGAAPQTGRLGIDGSAEPRHANIASARALTQAVSTSEESKVTFDWGTLVYLV